MPAILAVLVVAYSTWVTWTDNINPAGTKYNVWRMTGSCSPTEPTSTQGFTLITGPIKAKSFKDTTVKANKSYCYVITAVPKVGPQSNPSKDAQVKIP